MKLYLSPQGSDMAVKYSAEGQILTVNVDGVIDTFDFTDAPDGTFDEFASETLKICPLKRAVKDNGEITVWAFGWHGPKPERDWQQTTVTNDEGKIVDYVPEPEDEYQARVDEWDKLRYEQEVQL